MKIFLIFACYSLSVIGYSQDKGVNAIIIKNVSFDTACIKLMDAGYFLDKVDSNFKTVKTEFKDGAGKNKWMKIRLFVRVKDGAAILTGEWVNMIFVGSKFLGQEQNMENSVAKIENTWGNPKNCFNEMKLFAMKLGKDLEYRKD